jgi:hypothetical protein
MCDMNNLLSEFPNFELSYETMSHNKVHDSDIILAIPEGDNFFAWFTVYNDENVCVLIDSNKKNIQLIVTSFNDMLATSLGTIFYGTIFKHNGVSCFCIEDLYYYKGYEYTTKSYLNKIQIIKECLQKELCCNALTNKFTIFGLPIMNTNFNMLLREIEMLPYKIRQIQFRYSKIKKILFIKYYKPRSGVVSNDFDHGQKGTSNAIFKISPQIQNDIYNLFVYKNGKEEFYDVALIPDYTTSVLMNKLFRNIKENRNLDALEESDDEIEFENERDDKFVFLDRSFKMNCQYNYKFKKWVPISLAGKNDRIISANLIQK